MDKRAILPPAFSAPACLTSLSHDASEDFSLPEYMPPIRRIVSVEAVALPESRFLSDAALELGGTLSFSVLYIGEDGVLFCAPLTSEYTASCALGDTALPDAARIGVDTTVENVNCRVSGPRALTLRTRMKTRLTALSVRTVEERRVDTTGARWSPAEEQAVERRMEEARDVTLNRGELTATAGGTLPLGADTRIIRAGGVLRVEEARSAENAVSVRGEVILRVLYRTEEGTLATAEAKAPFSETVTVSGAEEGDPARAWGRVAAVTVKNGEGAYTWEIEYDLEAESARESVQAYTADAYSTSCAAEIGFAEAESMTLLRCGTSALSVTGEGGRQSKVSPGERIADVTATASADHWEIRGDQLVLHGVAAVSVLLCADGEAVSEEFTVPFRCELAREPQATMSQATMSQVASEMITRCAIAVTAATVRTEGERFAVHLELCISSLAIARETVRCVSSITLDRAAPTARRDGVIRICYPDPGESMWEIARRYAVPRAALGEAEVSDGSAIIV